MDLKDCRIGLLVVLLLAGGCATVGQPVEGIANFAAVDPKTSDFYRGAQPSREGIKTLKAMGVRTVIDLRDDRTSWEESAVVAAGMNYVWIPTNALRENPHQIRNFLHAVKSAERPIFVHCRQGRDRTGLEVAAYRLTARRDEWTREKVIEDLYAHGYNWFLFPNIERFIRTADFDALNASVAATASPSSGDRTELASGSR